MTSLIAGCLAALQPFDLCLGHRRVLDELSDGDRARAERFEQQVVALGPLLLDSRLSGVQTLDRCVEPRAKVSVGHWMSVARRSFPAEHVHPIGSLWEASQGSTIGNIETAGRTYRSPLKEVHMDTNTTTPAGSAETVVAVSSADLAALRARMASDVECPRCLVVECVGQACRLADHGDVSDEDAELVTVDEGSDAPMHVAREGVSLDVDEAQWRADNAVGLELGRRPLTVDPAAVETQAQFNARQAQGRAERLTRRPVTDPFRRLPVLDEADF